MRFRKRWEFHEISVWDDIILNALFVLVICAVIAVFIIGVLFLITNDTKRDFISYNEYAEKFNALSDDERELVAPLSKYQIVEGENNLPLKDLPDSFGEELLGALPIILCIVAVIVSGATFIAYHDELDSGFYLADLPFPWTYGWALLLLMFAGWPFFLVSAVRMLLAKFGIARDERLAIEKQVEEELSYVQPSPSERIRNIKLARRLYVAYRIRGQSISRQYEIRATNGKMTQYQRDLKEYGNRIKDTQRLIGETKLELKRLETIPVSVDETRAKAMAEWETIVAMRGVSAVRANKLDGKRQMCLTIDVRVRVPYRGALYDFGDYQVSILNGGFSCRRTRSGVLINPSSTTPNYGSRDGFCFGSRSGIIHEYIHDGQILEGLTLIIDSLHSVNDERVEREIPNCFRKVSTVRRIERRVWRKKMKEA